MRALLVMLALVWGCGSMLPGGEVRVASDRSSPQLRVQFDASIDEAEADDAGLQEERGQEEGADDAAPDAPAPPDAPVPPDAVPDAPAPPDAAPDSPVPVCPPVCVASSQCRPCGKSNCLQRRCM